MPTARRTNATKYQSMLRNLSVTAAAIPALDAASIPAGAQGTVVNFALKYHPIADAAGTGPGGEGDTSVTVSSGVVFTSHVGYKADADLANGEYYIDHLTGKARGRKDTAGTSQTFNYNIFVAQTSATLVTGDIELGAVELKDAGTDTRANILAANTARTTATIVLATQPIDEAGNVLGRTAANTARTTATLVAPVQLVDAAGTVAANETIGADGGSNTNTALSVKARLVGFNGTTWDRIRAGITTVTSTLTGWLNVLSWGIFNATPTVRTEGQGGPMQQDANGNTLVALGSDIRGERAAFDILAAQPKWNMTRITTATTTLIKSGAGLFGGIVYGLDVATNVTTCYDALTATGTAKYVQTTGAAILTDPGKHTGQLGEFTVGLTVVTSQAVDITILWL